MAYRFYTVFVLFAWLASMSWLFVAKIWPTLHGGNPPDYSSLVANVPADSQPTVWRITWKDRHIGMAASQTLRRVDGTALRYAVHFQHMPLETMLSEVFGTFGSMLFPGRTATKSPVPSSGSPGSVPSVRSNDQAMVEQQPIGLEMLLATELRFNSRRQFTGLQTVVDLADVRGFLRTRGRVDERHKLTLTTSIGGSAGATENQLRHEIDLPTNAVVNDAFAPRSELKNLHVGQKWTIPVCRPFPPNSPVQIVAAQAERHELILWDGHDVETILVVYHADAGSGLRANREPIAREWVRDDGLVLQHELRFSGTVIRFERIPESFHEPVTEYLSDTVHPRLWSR